MWREAEGRREAAGRPAPEGRPGKLEGRPDRKGRKPHRTKPPTAPDNCIFTEPLEP